MSFNLDLSKQAQHIFFSQKSKKPTHHPFVSKKDNASQIFPQKHLGFKLTLLDFKLTFEDHIKNILPKVNKTTGI